VTGDCTATDGDVLVAAEGLLQATMSRVATAIPAELWIPLLLILANAAPVASLRVPE
jgi:hypothetical protein